MKKNKSVAIVILTWNDWINTTQCLDSLLKSDYMNFDLVLVDNNSTELHYHKILEWCKKRNFYYNIINKKYQFSNLKIKKNKNLFIYRSTKIAKFPHAKNLGISAGYNKGLSFALKRKYDLIVRLDCDFIVPKNLIKGLVKTLNENDQCVAVSPKVYYYLGKKTKLIWWTNLNFSRNYFRFHRTGKYGNRRMIDKGQFKGTIKSDSICGCCVMFRADSLRKAIKLRPQRNTVLDEDFFFGPEDMELSNRLGKIGSILVNLDYFAYHKVSQSIHISGLKTHMYFSTIGWLLIVKKICSKTDRFICNSFFLLRAIVHFIKLFYKRDKEIHVGFLLGIRDYFLKY